MWCDSSRFDTSQFRTHYFLCFFVFFSCYLLPPLPVYFFFCFFFCFFFISYSFLSFVLLFYFVFRVSSHVSSFFFSGWFAMCSFVPCTFGKFTRYYIISLLHFAMHVRISRCFLHVFSLFRSLCDHGRNLYVSSEQNLYGLWVCWMSL